MSSSDKGHMGSFAEGEESLEHTEADHVTGHFSEGLEQDHAALAATQGSFSDGDLARHEQHERIGSFGDVDCPVCRSMAEAKH